MTATEQRTSGLFPHQNGRTSPKTVSCVSSNVGSITDFLFSTSHSTLSSSPNIPSNEIPDESSNEFQLSSPPPQILIHSSSEQCLDINEQQPSTTTVNQPSVKKFDLIFKKNEIYFFFEGIR
jgi:hypothetical protein